MRYTAAQIKNTQEYKRIASKGCRYHTPSFLLQVVTTQPESPLRFGLTASRKVGGAVQRNRSKRRLREVVRAVVKDYGYSGADVVVIAKTASCTYDFTAMRNCLIEGLNKCGVPKCQN